MKNWPVPWDVFFPDITALGDKFFKMWLQHFNNYFLFIDTKYLTKATSGKNVILAWRYISLSWQWKCGGENCRRSKRHLVAWLTQSAGRDKQMLALPWFLSYIPLGQRTWCDASTFKVDLPSSVEPLCRHTNKPIVFPWWLYAYMLTIKINHHRSTPCKLGTQSFNLSMPPVVFKVNLAHL